MTDRLKAIPCPFCGRDVEVVMQGGVFSDRFWFVYHPDLDGKCILEDQKFASLRGWNHRHTDNIRADSGEAVAYQIRIPTGNWHECTWDEFERVSHNRPNDARRLFTRPRATAVDVRDAERYRAVRECPTIVMSFGNYSGGAELDDRCDYYTANVHGHNAAIASREGEGK